MTRVIQGADPGNGVRKVQRENLRMTKPEFSVIIPVYNRTDLLLRAVGSVLRQEFSDFEIIIVDDGSADDIASIARAFSDDRISYHRQPNQGASAARNAGIDRARGRYVAFLDSDDTYLPHHLATMHAILERAPDAVAYSPIVAMRGKGRSFIKPPRPIAKGEQMATYLMCNRGFVQTSGVCLSREIAARVRYRNDAKFGDDTDFAVRLQLAGCNFIMADVPGVLWSDDLEHERLSDIRQPIGDLQWLEDLRPDIPARAYFGYRGWHLAKSVMQTHPFRALSLYFQAAIRGAYSPVFALVVLTQILMPNHYYRRLANFWIKRRAKRTAPRNAARFSDVARDRVSERRV